MIIVFNKFEVLFCWNGKIQLKKNNKTVDIGPEDVYFQK